MKAIDYFLAFLIIGLIGITILMIALNWNQSVRTKLFTSVLIGTGTILGLVYWDLKPERITDYFKASINIDDSTGMPAIRVVYPQPKRLELQLKYFNLGQPDFKYTDHGVMKVVHLFDKPTNFEETSAVYCELLQYYILTLIQESQQYVFPMSWMGDPRVVQPKQFSKMERVPQDLVGGLKDNRFFHHPFAKMAWLFPRLQLPSGTRIYLDSTHSPDKKRIEKYLIRLVKKFFFDITISIHSVGASQRAAFPEFELTQDKRENLSIYSFMISLDAKFHKHTSGNSRTPELKEWIRWTYDYIKEQISDEAMQK